MNSVADLDVFKLAHELALKIYSVTKKFPREETYSLVDQMRRAAISARDLNYISPETYQELRSGYDRVVQMLSRLSQSLADEPRSR